MVSTLPSHPTATAGRHHLLWAAPPSTHRGTIRATSVRRRPIYERSALGRVWFDASLPLHARPAIVLSGYQTTKYWVWYPGGCENIWFRINEINGPAVPGLGQNSGSTTHLQSDRIYRVDSLRKLLALRVVVSVWFPDQIYTIPFYISDCTTTTYFCAKLTLDFRLDLDGTGSGIEATL